MGRRGPKPQSAEERMARGNPGKRRIVSEKPAGQEAKKVAKPGEGEIVRPAWLTDRLARKIWDSLRSGSSAAHFVKASDINAFARYCTYMANWIDANKKLTKMGDPVYETQSNHGTMLRVHPLHIVRSRLEDDLVKLEGLLGLTPSDRLKISRQMAETAPPGGLFDQPSKRDQDDEKQQDMPLHDNEVPTVGALGKPH